jgi:nucleoside-diphosphate-sugar epimerase
MRNLITGATGFVGSHIAERLAREGEDVVALVRKTGNIEFLRKISVRFAYGDINDRNSVKEAMKGVEVVYHSAALADEMISYDQAYKVNVEGTRNLLDCAIEAKVKRFVFISSLAVLGMRDHHGTTADAPYQKTKDSYIDTKIDSEQLVMDYYGKYGLPVTVIRPGFVFGPRDNKVIPRILENIRNGRFMFIGSGKNKINSVYVENLTDAIMLAAKSDKAIGQKYNVTNDSGMTLEDLISKITDIWGLEKPNKRISKGLAYFVCNMLTGWAMLTKATTPPLITKARIKFLSLNLDFDIKKTREDLGYVPRVSIEDGLKRTREWLEKEKAAVKS